MSAGVRELPTGIAGFLSASNVERPPTESAIAGQVRRFNAISADGRAVERIVDSFKPSR